MISSTLIDKKSQAYVGFSVNYVGSKGDNLWELVLYEPELKNRHGHHNDMKHHWFTSIESLASFLLDNYNIHLSLLRLLSISRKEWNEMSIGEKKEAIIYLLPTVRRSQPGS